MTRFSGAATSEKDCLLTRNRPFSAQNDRPYPHTLFRGRERVCEKNLPQVAEEAANSVYRGKSLFFETSGVSLKEGVTTGQLFITELLGSNSSTIMYYYDRVSLSLAGYTILYRVEISNIGVAKYTIDSFR